MLNGGNSVACIDLPEVPCDLEFVHFIINYFKYGCLPFPIRNVDMYHALSQSFDYLLCDEATKLIALDDETLNFFSSDDFRINRDNISLYDLFDHDGLWVELKIELSDYPLVFKSSEHMLDRHPVNLMSALHRVFHCNTCDRSSFFCLLLDDANEYRKNICIAGGCLQYMFRVDTTHRTCDMSDVDIFLIDFDFSRLPAFMLYISTIYRCLFGDFYVLRTKFAITFFSLRPKHRNTIQIIVRNHTSISDVLSNFDLDSSCFAYDGKSIMANARGLRCIKTSCNTVDVSRQSTTFEKRLQKYYCKYDVGISVPNYNPFRLMKNEARFGLSQLLAKNIPKSRFHNYSSCSISNSQNIEQLRLGLDSLSACSPYQTSFILRFNNVDLYEYFGDENVDMDPALYRTSFLSSEGTFIPTIGPWYAEAYGGHNISEWQTKINDAILVRGKHKIRNYPKKPSDVYIGNGQKIVTRTSV
jgi:hypothetical protein